MRSNTTTTRVFALAAAAACAAGLSACQSDVPVPEPTAGGGTATAAPSAGTEQPTSTTPTGAAPTGTPTGTPTAAPSAGAAEAQNIEPITFTDEAVGLTETCDQIVPDFDAPKYKAQSDHQTDTVYLVHCTLDFSGNLSSTPETNHALNLIDDNDQHHMTMLMQASLDDDMKQAGLHSIGYDDYGTNHIDGWYGFVVLGVDGKAAPMPEGATTLAYERSSLTGKDGKTYEAYSTRAKVTVKNG